MSIFPKHINRFNTISIKFQQGVLREIKKMTLKYMWKCKESTIAKVILEMKAWKLNIWDFPGGPVVKNSPANSGDTGLIPGPGRFHMLRGNEDHASQLLSLCSQAQKPQLLKPAYPRAHAPQQEKPPQWEAHTPQWRVAPARCNHRRSACSNRDPAQSERN